MDREKDKQKMAEIIKGAERSHSSWAEYNSIKNNGDRDWHREHRINTIAQALQEAGCVFKQDLAKKIFDEIERSFGWYSVKTMETANTLEKIIIDDSQEENTLKDYLALKEKYIPAADLKKLEG